MDSALDGAHSLTVNVKDAYGVQVGTMVIPITFSMSCSVATITVPADTAHTYMLDATAQTFSYAAFSISPASCAMTFDIEIPTAISTVVSYDIATRTFSLAATHT